MKKCLNCQIDGFQDDDAFCPECGSKLAEAEAPAAESPAFASAAPAEAAAFAAPAAAVAADAAPAPEFAAQDSQPAPSAIPASGKTPKFNAGEFFGKNKKALGIGGIAVVALAAAIAIAPMFGQVVPKDLIEQDLMASDIVQEGVVPGKYVNLSEYELTKFKVTNQEESTQYLFGEPIEVCTVTYSGTIKNENFESDFTASSAYYKEGENWVEGLSPDIITSTTTPLKGVDYIVKDSSEAFSSVSFESTFEGSNGVYTSTATEEVKYEFWFADDTAKNVQTFLFSEEEGWQPKGEVEVSDLTTTWKLEGKSFEATDEVSSWGGPRGSFNSTITFVAAEEGSLAANYVVNFATSEESNSYATYHNYSVDSQAVGTPQKKFGADSFSVELNDAGNLVTLECSTTSSQTVAGSGTVHALRVGILTDAPYRTDPDDGSVERNFNVDLIYSELV